ncbi:FtsX-like permease family protein [Heyndrickxia sp. NPDC080065]|uniref:FtsX-like permease family protein n=1 Tax=Heyndrickxia sp. NPDC080065 TaxID=3390568 RepID=UPI003D003427
MILSCLGLGYLSSQSVSNRIVIQAKDDLKKHWRYQYDILVLPKQEKATKGLEDGWVAPQASVASYGGISMNDLKKIRSITGVKVAAPLSLLGYFDFDQLSANYNKAETGSFHIIRTKVTAFDGLHTHIFGDHSHISEYAGSATESSILSQAYKEENGGFVNYMPPGGSLRFPNEMMLIAIDPAAEEEIYKLSNSMTDGENLTNATIEYDQGMPILPILALTNQKYDVNETLTITEIQVPKKVSKNDLKTGATNYLNSLPKKEVTKLSLPTMSEEWRYKQVNLLLDENNSYVEEPYMVTFAERDLRRYTPLQYKIVQNESGAIPQLELKSTVRAEGVDKNLDMPIYRQKIKEDEMVPFAIDIVGYYDSDKIKPQLASSWKKGDPVDIYTPHHSMIIKDGTDKEMKPTPLLPLPLKDSYYTGAPDAITILDAASSFYGDKPPLSSIRVVVDGVNERSEESQRKIENVAQQIVEETGHRVEIMLGSSASKVHIDLGINKPGQVGMVEEGWQQKGVSWSIEKQIEKTNILLFIYLLMISFIFCYTVITQSLLRRSVDFAMLRAVGWSRFKIVQTLMVEVIGLSILSVSVMFFANLWLKTLSWYHFIIIWILMMLLIGIGYLTGSRKALKLSPRAGLEGEGTEWSFMRWFAIRSLYSYVLHQLLRRPLRFGLLALSLALSTFMSILFIATQQSLSDFLFLSFLGETVDLNLKSFQTIFLVIGLLLTVSIVFLLLFMNINERKKEFFILRSIGWSLKRIQYYIGIETIFVAAIGSTVGTISAYIALTFFSSLWIPVWTVIVFIVGPVSLMWLFSFFIVQSIKMQTVVKDQHAA